MKVNEKMMVSICWRLLKQDSLLKLNCQFFIVYMNLFKHLKLFNIFGTSLIFILVCFVLVNDQQWTFEFFSELQVHWNLILENEIQKSEYVKNKSDSLARKCVQLIFALKATG